MTSEAAHHAAEAQRQEIEALRAEVDELKGLLEEKGPSKVDFIVNGHRIQGTPGEAAEQLFDLMHQLVAEENAADGGEQRYEDKGARRIVGGVEIHPWWMGPPDD